MKVRGIKRRDREPRWFPLVVRPRLAELRGEWEQGKEVTAKAPLLGPHSLANYPGFHSSANHSSAVSEFGRGMIGRGIKRRDREPRWFPLVVRRRRAELTGEWEQGNEVTAKAPFLGPHSLANYPGFHSSDLHSSDIPEFLRGMKVRGIK